CAPSPSRCRRVRARPSSRSTSASTATLPAPAETHIAAIASLRAPFSRSVRSRLVAAPRKAHLGREIRSCPMVQDAPTASVLAAGLKGRCPHCGEGALFRRGLVLRDKCDRCGLSFAFADSGDGPAVFATFILGFLVLGGALLVEFKLNPPV